eukprot:1947149-Rhodomonas_salina.1
MGRCGHADVRGEGEAARGRRERRGKGEKGKKEDAAKLQPQPPHIRCPPTTLYCLLPMLPHSLPLADDAEAAYRHQHQRLAPLK